MTTNTQLNSLYGLLEQVLPIWAAQIQASRNITDESITHLSQLFYGLSQRIQTTVALKSQNHSVGTLIKIFQDTQLQQQAMIQSSINERQALSQAIANISVCMSGNTLSEERDEAILYAMELAKSFERKDAQVLTQYDQSIKQVEKKLDVFTHELSHQTERLNTESQHICKDISDVLVSLQFQDRVNQMLAHVNNDLNKLDSAIKEAAADINPEGWIADFAKAYVMQEQRDIHNQVVGKVEGASPLSSSSADEITFF